LGFLGGYSAQEGVDSGHAIFLLSALGLIVALPAYAVKIYLIALGLVLMALGALMVFVRPLLLARETATKIIAQRALLLGCVLMAGLSPHYPWYYCWLLIPACIMPWSSVLYLVTATFLLYLNPIHTELFWPAFLYWPFVVLALLDARAGKVSVAVMSLQPAEGDKI
jgi:alpha-1,6-mannosyltransferase